MPPKRNTPRTSPKAAAPKEPDELTRYKEALQKMERQWQEAVATSEDSKLQNEIARLKGQLQQTSEHLIAEKKKTA